MTLLDPEHTVQVSPSTATAISVVRAWIAGEHNVCIVTAPIGTGKSHFLRAATGAFADAIIMPPAGGSDCTNFLVQLKNSSRRRVIADDLDLFPKKLREDVIRLAGESNHSLLGSMKEIDGRTTSLIKKSFADDVVRVTLESLGSRSGDLEIFVSRWAEENGFQPEPASVRECTEFCRRSALPQGFRTVISFLSSLSEESRWHFSGPLQAADAASAYNQATSPPPSRPTLLVEGYTDRLYLEWLLKDLPAAEQVEVRDCGGATLVASETITLRNLGRACVAVLDSDSIGLGLRKQLKEFGHQVASVPTQAVDLPPRAYEHVKEVAEIEDLLPVGRIEEFLRSRECSPELEIRTPTGVRYVISEEDKTALAQWFLQEVGRHEVPKLKAFLDQALELLAKVHR